MSRALRRTLALYIPRYLRSTVSTSMRLTKTLLHFWTFAPLAYRSLNKASLVVSGCLQRH